MPVVVERDAGALVGCPDADYRESGADIVERAEVFAGADIVAWVKPPVYQLDSMPLRDGMMLVGFQDPLYRDPVIAGLRARGVESVGFETVSRDRPDIDALSAMSRIAGEIAYTQGRQLLSVSRQGRVRALVLGCGAGGLAAIAAAAAHGDEVAAIGNRAEQGEIAIGRGAAEFLVNPTGPVRDYLTAWTPDLIVCAAVHRGARGPILMDDTALGELRSGTVIVDLVAKAGGNCAATVPDRTVTLPNGVVVTHRSNYPALRPEQATRAYSAAVAAMIRQLRSPAAPETL